VPSLYVAHDDRRVIVSRLPLEIVGGRGTTFSWGEVVEISPEDGAGTPHGAWAKVFRGLAAVITIFFVSNVLNLLLPGVIAVAVAIGVGVVVFGWRRKPGVISAPQLSSRREQHHVLVSDLDRKVFSEAIDLCERKSKTWPALGGLVDVPVAERQLAQALLEIAGVLERRQEVRDLRAELAEHAGASVLAPRLEKATAALAELDSEVTRRMAALNAVAVAGERLISDERIGALAREADDVLARLSPAESGVVSDAGSELAESIEEVLRAYRELTDRPQE
jgi:hypothetical protein